MFLSKFDTLFNLKPRTKTRIPFVPSKNEFYFYPSCLNCKYAIQRDHEQRVSVCNLFYVNLVNKKVNESTYFNFDYLSTDACRVDPELCGLSGKYFKKK